MKSLYDALYTESLCRQARRPVMWIPAITLLLSACAGDRFVERPPAWAETLQGDTNPLSSVTTPISTTTPPAMTESPDRAAPDPAFYKPGSGVLIRPAASVISAREQSDGDVKLNFQSANLLEVIKVIMGDMLSLNYTVDESVQGVVSMQTTRALHRDDLIPTLELLLRMNNAALIVENDLYRVVPLARALAEARAPQLGDSKIALPAGFSVNVVPLKYIAAEEMAQILEPFVTDANQLLRVDSSRNLLILASGGAQMERLLDTIDVFDVDRMAGMSVALFTPDFVDASTLAEDLGSLLADPEQGGLMSGLVRFIVVERLNGLIVVTPRAEHLARVREWVQRLDRNTGDANQRLFVYRVQNGKAVELAETLNLLFNEDSDTQKPPVKLAPGLKKATIGEDPKMIAERDAAPAPERPAVPIGNAEDGLKIERNSRVQIIADEGNNALLILAKGAEYRQILAALRQLDVSPLQVLIEVTIAEVTLSDNLRFGVEWFFRNNFGDKTGLGTLDLGTAGLNALQPGFSYALQGGGTVRAVLNALASETNLSVISSPSLLVLNNEEATIQVGDEVPVSVQQQQATTANSNIINSIEYRETGILLRVKPRVNAGGLVIMEVEQEASQVPSTNNTDPLTPRIRQRKIKSTVAVNSGDTIVLGGLIENNRDRSESGVPLLHKVPGLGPLFGFKEDNQGRTELIVLITPRAVSDSTAALQVTDTFRRRLQKLIPARTVDESATTAPAGEAAAAGF
ncbi:MAG: type II secretion system secretin GspD [Gammaproteobacteria bacterium]|nr:type II secretion system secretin GspD [Gammaproteobacteria bacterium]